MATTWRPADLRSDVVEILKAHGVNPAWVREGANIEFSHDGTILNALIRIPLTVADFEGRFTGE